MSQNRHSFKARSTALAVSAGLSARRDAALALALLAVLIITLLSGAGSPA